MEQTSAITSSKSTLSCSSTSVTSYLNDTDSLTSEPDSSHSGEGVPGLLERKCAEKTSLESDAEACMRDDEMAPKCKLNQATTSDL